MTIGIFVTIVGMMFGLYIFGKGIIDKKSRGILSGVIAIGLNIFSLLLNVLPCK
ncbi:MAG: hypothetical protein GY928_08070 [Colwellia sp.]|nr:hypothetical protein [Colwellia sp.]